MKTLYICKSDPDEMTSQLINIVTPDSSGAKTVLLSDDTDWAGVVDDIFAFDRVICWW
ncbi:conserved hypothetical protein [Candidatus Desulfarcum epimagneticum]|uniref:Uncharacterized protein n=1 Tax=uncultured Desulfobacteraceae bacterium TaxID=218296 RepID=A0A484HDQ7_9BACT|nr:conserved hypothetical protein [uncultured Desulfobacteraceae bacterium]